MIGQKGYHDNIYRAINGGLRAVIIPARIKHFQFGKLRVISIYPRARMALREVFLRGIPVSPLLKYQPI